jgi:uncharacterized spore protein YtfJ
MKRAEPTGQTEPAESGGSERTVLEILRRTVQDSTAGTVFGEPITRGEITLVPVARVSGRGGGGGGGPAAGDHAKGSGGGLALSARPVGVFVVKDGKVDWRPSVDINRAILGGQIVAVVALLTLRTFLRTRRP